MSHFTKLLKSTYLSSCIAISPQIANADNQGFHFSIGLEETGAGNQYYSLSTRDLTHYADPLNLFPERLKFTFNADRFISAAVKWDSRPINMGNFQLSYGGGVQGTYSNNGYLDADFTATYHSAADRLSNAIAEFAPDGMLTNEMLEEINSTLVNILLLTQEPNNEGHISHADIINLLPDDLDEAQKQEIISFILANQNTYLDHPVKTDFSGPSQYLSFSANSYMKGEWQRPYGADPCFQIDAGYQVSGFVNHNQEGAYYHGPTASLSIGVTEDFNNWSWSVFLKQDFSFEHQGPYGLETKTPDDLSLGFSLSSNDAIHHNITGSVDTAGELSIKYQMNF